MAASPDDIAHLRHLLHTAHALVVERIEKGNSFDRRTSKQLELLANNLSSLIDAVDQDKEWVVEGLGKGAGFGASKAIEDWGWNVRSSPFATAVRDAEEFFRTGKIAAG